ncbi:MAG: NERD domain-containing protein [Smithella sp.]
MDLSPVINPMIRCVVLYLIPLIFLLAILRSPWFKDFVGEFIVNTLGKLMIDKNEYHLIKNVTLPIENGTTQIDHVIVSVYGVFVVETKNIKGWIFGSPNQPMWTQKIYKHSDKFQNPLHQNYKHVKTLEQLLGLKDDQIHSLVVFIGDSTFKTEMPENVTYGFGYIRYIKSKKRRVLSPAEVKDIIKIIEAERLVPPFKTHQEHVMHVKKIISEKQSNVICPQCGGPMVMRESKKGQNAGKQFWGCSRFPQCRGIVNIT